MKLFTWEIINIVLTISGTICWGICFFWMKKISCRQDKMLSELNGQSKRIEKLSKSEHQLIKEVHPQVSEIKENLQTVVKIIDEGISVNNS